MSDFAGDETRLQSFRHGEAPEEERELRTLALVAHKVELIRKSESLAGGMASWTDEQDVPKAITREKAAEIAADFMTTFHRIQISAFESQEFRTQAFPYWLVCFSDSIKGPLRQMLFVALLPDGTVVEPRVAKRL
jgi:hypothetical protein